MNKRKDKVASLSLILALALVCVPPLAAQSLVATVEVTVTDGKGNYITGLRAENFRLSVGRSMARILSLETLKLDYLAPPVPGYQISFEPPFPWREGATPELKIELIGPDGRRLEVRDQNNKKVSYKVIQHRFIDSRTSLGSGLAGSAQDKNVTGTWIGTADNATARLSAKVEAVLTETNGVVLGCSSTHAPLPSAGPMRGEFRGNTFTYVQTTPVFVIEGQIQVDGEVSRGTFRVKVSDGSIQTGKTIMRRVSRNGLPPGFTLDMCPSNPPADLAQYLSVFGGPAANVAGTTPPSSPSVEVLDPSEEQRGTLKQVGGKSIRVRGKAKDANGVFGVTINGQQASMRAIDSQTVEFWLDEVLLRPGKNDITIVATNTQRVEGKLTFAVERAETEIVSTGSPEIPDRWALVVGISDYGPAAGGIGSLQYARRDAEAFYKFLRSPEGGSFADDHILFLADQQATSANLRSGIRDFLGRAGENDLVVIFFAGHGTPDPARPSVLYLLTHDSDPDRLGGTAFDMDEIKLALAKNISARRVVAFVDACHSAGVGTTFTARAAPNSIAVVNRYLAELAQSRPGVVMLTASQSNEPSWEDARWGGGHGVFTHYLLEGLRGAADRDADSKVSLQEIIDFVSDRVKRDTDYKQHPTASTSPMWDPNLPLAVVPRP